MSLRRIARILRLLQPGTPLRRRGEPNPGVEPYSSGPARMDDKGVGALGPICHQGNPMLESRNWRNLRSQGVSCMVFVRRFRISLIALAAFVGTVPATHTAIASPTSPDRARAMRQNGCCCVTHTSGCCCETSEPIHLSGTPAAESGPEATPGADGQQDSGTGRTCQCRSGGDPARARSNFQSKRGNRRLARASAESLAGLCAVAAPAPPAQPVSPRACPPKAPLYLLTARLLI